MKKIFSVVLLLMSIVSFAQTENEPLIWEVNSTSIGDDTYEIRIEGKLLKGFHTYSQHRESDDGPEPTEILFNLGQVFELIGSAEEIGIQKHFEPVFDMEVSFFDSTAKFIQKVKMENKGLWCID